MGRAGGSKQQGHARYPRGRLGDLPGLGEPAGLEDGGDGGLLQPLLALVREVEVVGLKMVLESEVR